MEIYYNPPRSIPKRQFNHAGYVYNLPKVPNNLLLLCIVRYSFQTSSALAVVGLRKRLSVKGTGVRGHF